MGSVGYQYRQDSLSLNFKQLLFWITLSSLLTCASFTPHQHIRTSTLIIFQSFFSFIASLLPSYSLNSNVYHFSFCILFSLISLYSFVGGRENLDKTVLLLFLVVVKSIWRKKERQTRITYKS